MDWKVLVENKISKVIGAKVEFLNYSHVGAGSINETLQVNTSHGVYFVKKNSALRYPKMFEKEARGISLLGDTNEIVIPEIIGYDENSSEGFLILKYIESGIKQDSFWELFGKQLASLHKHTDDLFGLDYDNYIGSLKQSNNKNDSWSAFLRDERLEIQLKMARDRNLILKDTVSNFHRFYNRIDEIFPEEPPALIHGDLWSGNFMVNQNDNPVIIDPAVYYGHREMDIAMSQLFGGFDIEFYESYNTHYPLENGWQQRMELCNLYPLMVHVNLFGGSYVGSVNSIIKKF